MLLQNTWIRPEDIHHYDGLFDTVMLATRMHLLPGLVIYDYVRRKFFGNTLDLFEPGLGRAIAPYIINNSTFPTEWFTRDRFPINLKSTEISSDIFGCYDARADVS